MRNYDGLSLGSFFKLPLSGSFIQLSLDPWPKTAY